MGLQPTNRTSGHSRGLDLIAYYQALIEADLREQTRVPAGQLAPTEAKQTGWELHQKGLDLESRQDLTTEKRRKGWSQFLDRHRIDEDSAMQQDAERMHVRAPLHVPANVQATVATNQTLEAKDAIQGSGRRSIPKRSVGRGSLVGRTDANAHVEAHASAGRTGSGSAKKLGVNEGTMHRPQGFGGGRGAFVFT